LTNNLFDRVGIDLDTSGLAGGGALAELGEEVGDVVPRVTVETSAKSLLVEEVGNQTNGATKDEQTVEHTHLEVVLGLLRGEGTAVAEQVNEADGDSTVNVEDEVVLLAGGDSLDGNSVVEELGGGEVGLAELLDERDTEIGVVARLDTVTNTGNELVLLPHGVNEVTGRKALVVGAGELLSGAVKSTTEARANGQETRDEGRDQVLAGTGGDDGVHGTRHGGTVVGSKHEDHLEELGSVVGKTAAEPEERHDTTDTDVVLEDVGNGHAGIEELLSTVVGNGGDEGSRLTDETKLLGPGVVNGDLGNSRLLLGLDAALGNEILVDLCEDSRELLESLGNVEAGLTHGRVLDSGGLELRVGERTSVAELDLSGEQTSDSADGPGNNRLGDDTGLDCLDHTVLLNTTNLTEKDEDLALRVGLVAKHVVDESGTGVPVATNGNTLVHTIGGLGNNVVELVGHTTRLGDVTNGTLAVELGGNDVVHHATSVTDLVSTRLDATNGGRANDGDALLLGNVKDLTCTSLRDTLSDDGNRLDLRELHELHCGLENGTGRSKVDDSVDVGVLCHGVGSGLVDREEGLSGAPVPEDLSIDCFDGLAVRFCLHLADELTTESVDDTGDRRLLALADEVEIKHTLDGLGLHSAVEIVSLAAFCFFKTRLELCIFSASWGKTY
jgi:hypothetical protein